MPSDSALPEQGSQRQRLDLDALVTYFNEHCREGNTNENMFLERECDKLLPTAHKAVKCFVFPKYQLRFAVERPDDMQSAMNLALATTSAEVKAAAVHKVNNVYDLNRHSYLRRTFVTVFVTTDGSVLDGHKHFIEAAGQSEHAIFVKGFVDEQKFNLKGIKMGPKNSMPGYKPPSAKGKHHSERLKKMLGPPEHEEALGDMGAAAEPLRPPQCEAPMGDKGIEAEPPLPVQLSCGPAPPQGTNAGQVAAIADKQKCMARVWGDGNLNQCAMKPTPGSEYCGRHKINSPMADTMSRFLLSLLAVLKSVVELLPPERKVKEMQSGRRNQ